VLTDLNILQDEIDTQQDAYYKSNKSKSNQLTSLFYGAAAILRSRQSLNHPTNYQHFTEPEGSLQCSQDPSIAPHLEPGKSSPYHPILFL
jgi:hypothetical protein